VVGQYLTHSGYCGKRRDKDVRIVDDAGQTVAYGTHKHLHIMQSIIMATLP
jgi:hypothetical protein